MNTNKVYDSLTDTYINTDTSTDNSIDKSIDNTIINTNERIIWQFTIGIPIDTTSDYSSEKQTENFENAIFEMTTEITKITDGLTYEYCTGMWLRRNQGSLELHPLLKKNNSNTGNDSIEHNLSVRISIIVLPEIANEIYNLVKNIISKVNKKYELGLIHIQAMKTIGTAHHFVLE
jgi:hypothetical protein